MQTSIFWKIIISAFIILGCSQQKTAFTGTTEKLRIQNKQKNEADSIKRANAVAARSFEKEIKLSRIENTHTKFSIASLISETDITLVQSEASESITLVQNDYPAATDKFLQGTLGTNKSESLAQANFGLLDILVVIDNSGSMSQEQQNLGNKLSPLLSAVKDSNWQIGIITTDASSSSLRDLIKKGESNVDARFQNAINAGSGGSSDERGIHQSIIGLQKAGFVRSNSSIAVLIVSDEDDSRFDSETDATLIDYITNTLHRPIPSQARIYGLYWIPGTTCATGAIQGSVYHSAVSKTQGQSGSICQADYTNTLNFISNDFRVLLKQQWELQQAPDAGSTQLSVNGNAVTSGYSVNGRTLSFTNPPPAGASISISYTVGKSGIIDTTFTLDKKIAPNNKPLVYVNGAIISNSFYGITNEKQGKITFKTPPPSGATILVNYQEDVDLQAIFKLGANIKPNSISVTNESIALTNFTFDNVQGLIFETPPPAGSSIIAKFIRFGEKTLAYPMSIGMPILEELKAEDIITKENIPVTYADNKLVFDSERVTNGRVIRISYKNNNEKTDLLTLPHLPLPGSVIVKPNISVCEKDNFVVSNADILLNCELAADNEIDVSYKYITEVISEIDISEIKECSQAKVTLQANGKPFSNFTIEGCIIKLQSNVLAPESIVKISAVVN